MANQPTLPGFEPSSGFLMPEFVPDPEGKLKGYSLFLALLPAPNERLRTAQFAIDLKRQHQLKGKIRPPEILHITLLEFFDTPVPIPMSHVDAIRLACTGVVCPQFSLVFDRVRAFAREKDEDLSPSVFLRCGRDGDAAVARLRNELGKALRNVGVHYKVASAPHITLLYGSNPTIDQPIEPIEWKATRVAMILSHQGLTHHQSVGEWLLR